MGFLLEYLKNPRFIGAVAPSGINLSRRMIRPINFKTAEVIVEYAPERVHSRESLSYTVTPAQLCFSLSAIPCSAMN